MKQLKAITNGAKKASHPVLSGLTYAFAIAIVLALIFAFLLYFTSLSDAKLPLYSYIVTASSLLIGGFVSGRRGGEKGWYYGGLTGIIYGLVLAIISFLGFDLDFNLKSLVLLVLTFLFGSLGGIFGVNSSNNR